MGVRIERVMTDNGSMLPIKTFRAACKHLGLRQVFTKPYTPRTTERLNALSNSCANGLRSPINSVSDQPKCPLAARYRIGHGSKANTDRSVLRRTTC